MNKVRRVTVNLPSELLEEAMDVTDDTLTQTLVEGLKMVKRTKAYYLAQKLKGKISIDVDIEESRGRKSNHR